MNIIFFGSSDFSLAALEACLETPRKVTLAVTTPDQKRGRGLNETPTPVRLFCEKRGIPVLAPSLLRDEKLLEKVRAIKPEFFVVASYGKIITANWLKIPSRFALNVHPSLLPKYRGAAPIHWAILNGDRETGLTIAEVTNQLDAGDIFYQTRIPLDSEIDSEELSTKLAELSREALRTVFRNIEQNKLSRTSQQESLASYARKLKKEDGIIDWQQPAASILNKVRGLLPWPIAITYYKGEPLQILKARAEDATSAGRPGQILEIRKEGAVVVRAGEGVLLIEQFKPAGKKVMSAADYARGKRIQPGSLFESTPSPGTQTQ